MHDHHYHDDLLWHPRRDRLVDEDEVAEPAPVGEPFAGLSPEQVVVVAVVEHCSSSVVGVPPRSGAPPTAPAVSVETLWTAGCAVVLWTETGPVQTGSTGEVDVVHCTA